MDRKLLNYRKNKGGNRRALLFAIITMLAVFLLIMMMEWPYAWLLAGMIIPLTVYALTPRKCPYCKRKMMGDKSESVIPNYYYYCDKDAVYIYTGLVNDGI